MVVRAISTTSGKIRGYVRARAAQLRARGYPFFVARLDGGAIVELLNHLDACCNESRHWYTLAAIQPDLTRLTIVRATTPAYEREAAPCYARGDVFRVSGGSKSCNIDFAAGEGAAYLARQLRTAQARMQEYLEIRVPSAKRHIVEFCPDVDIEAEESSEYDRLAVGSEKAAADALPAEDFSDWE